MNKTGMKRVSRGFAWTFSLLAAASAFSQSPPTSPVPGSGVANINVVLAQASADQAIFFLALEAGYFKDAGVNVGYKLLPAAGITPQLVSGESDIAMGSTNFTFGVTAAGRPTTVVFAFLGNGSVSFGFGKPGIKSLNDCTTLVTSIPGTAGYSWAIVLKDLFKANYEIRTVGDPSLAGTQLASGQVDCSILNYGSVAKAVQEGKANIIFDPRNKASLPPGYPMNVAEASFWTLETVAKEKSDAIGKFVKALDRANKDFILGGSSAKAADMLMKNADFRAAMTREDLVKRFEFSAPFQAPNRGYITSDSWDATLKFAVQGQVPKVSMNDPLWSYKNRVSMVPYERSIGKP